MKQKYNKIFISIVRFLLLAVLFVASIFPSQMFEQKTAEAMDLCSGIDLNVAVFDTSANSLLGSFDVSGSGSGWSQFSVDATYGHVLRYTFTTSGTPSFTAGYSYNTVGYSSSAHTWSPGANGNMSNVFTAPAITDNATYWSMVAENICSDNPPFYGDQTASMNISVNVIGNPGPTLISRSATSNVSVFERPAVSILGRKAGTNNAFTNLVNIDPGESVEVSWATSSVNNGQSCFADPHDHPSYAGTSTEPYGWYGLRNGPGGGTQIVGPFPIENNISLPIVCYGFNGTQTMYMVVQVIVGPAPYLLCSTTGGNLVLPKGNSDIIHSLVQVVSNGTGTYDNLVQFEATISPLNPGSPTLSINPPGPIDLSVSGGSSGLTTVTTNSTTGLGVYTVDVKVRDTVTNVLTDCGTRTVTVVPAASATGNIDCDANGSGGYSNGPCSIPSGSSINIKWESTNVTSCTVEKWDTNNPSPTLWASTTSEIKNSGALTAASTTYDFNCSGAYGNVSDQVVVNVTQQNNPPPSSTVSNATCTKIIVSWEVPVGGVPTGYNIYRKLGSEVKVPFGTPIASNIASSPYLDGTASTSELYIYGVSAVYSGVESSITTQSNPPISPIPCNGSLDGSDKDSVVIGGFSATLNACNDSPEVPSNFTIANSGDTITFRICVINSGTENLTNVTVTELPNDNQYTQNLTNIKFVDPNPKDPEICAGAPAGDTWVIGDMDASVSPAPPNSCYIYVTAQIVEPTGPPGDLYRAQNVASITADFAGGSVSKQVRSSLLFFSKGGGIPDRGETPAR